MARNAARRASSTSAASSACDPDRFLRSVLLAISPAFGGSTYI
jgi:hypothetical protein